MAASGSQSSRSDIRLNPVLSVAHSNRCTAYNDKGEFDKAILDCVEAIRLDPNYANAFNNRGNAHLGKSDYERAIQDYDEAIWSCFAKVESTY